MGGDTVYAVSRLLTFAAFFGGLYLVIWLAMRYRVVAVGVALLGAVVTAGGLWYWAMASSPENRIGNQWWELGVAIGMAIMCVGAVVLVFGVWAAWVTGKSQPARAASRPRPPATGCADPVAKGVAERQASRAPSHRWWRGDARPCAPRCDVQSRWSKLCDDSI